MDLPAVWDWLLRDRTLAGVTWLGTVFGGLGIFATYRQARAARTAAEAAASAVHTLRTRINIANLAYSYTQVELVRSLVQTGNLPPAQAVFHALKRIILEACFSLSAEVRLVQQIQVIERHIGMIELHIDLGIQRNPQFDASSVTRALSGISSFLAKRERDLKFLGEGV